MTELPPVTQEPIRHVDATPDEGYPVRILEAYLENKNVRWISEEPNPLLDSMNRAQEVRGRFIEIYMKLAELGEYCMEWISPDNLTDGSLRDLEIVTIPYQDLYEEIERLRKEIQDNEKPS